MSNECYINTLLPSLLTIEDNQDQFPITANPAAKDYLLLKRNELSHLKKFKSFSHQALCKKLVMD